MDRLVTAAWLEAELGAPDLCILDCRVDHAITDDGGQRFTPGSALWEAGHIPGARHVDLLVELSDASSPIPLMLPPAADFAAVMSRVGVGQGRRVVLYDSMMNIWAARAWWMLRAYGFDDAAILDGGWQTWTAEERPVSSDEPEGAEPVTFVPRPRPGVFAGRDQVVAALGDDGVTVLSALERPVHRGERADYGRPGHIPGACNVPFVELVDPTTHRYLPAGRLREAFAGAVDGESRRVITYCGAGVAAASDAFVLTLLGHEGVSVYDGSLIEWAADGSLPLVLGD